MCTSLKLNCLNGDIFYGRTMEFAQNLWSHAVYLPKGLTYKSSSAFGKKDGKTWTSSYAVTGMAVLKTPLVVDGLNDQGLVVAGLFFPGYAVYQDSSNTAPETIISNSDLITYLLGTCQTVSDVKSAVQSLCVVGVPLLPDRAPEPLHYTVHDKNGDSLVIEYVEGQLNCYNNPLGVLTNSPPFPWHIDNLSNFINLQTEDIKTKTLGPLTLNATGMGSGLLGLPGDFTPPSRFVRAAFFSQLSHPAMDATEGTLRARHLMNQFDIPKGSIRKHNTHPEGEDYTQWTTIADLNNQLYYFHTYNDLEEQVIDLKTMNPQLKTPLYASLTRDSNVNTVQFERSLI